MLKRFSNLALWVPILGVLLLAVATLFFGVINFKPPDANAQATREYVGSAICSDCHVQASEHWAHTIHAKVFAGNPRTDLEATECEACHGPGSAHVENPSDLTNIISYTSLSKSPVPQQNAQCLGCHQTGGRSHWMASAHERADVACADCHNPMANFSERGLLAEASVHETCFGCHQTQRAEFRRRSHMPLFEGKVTCTNCHDPHGSPFDGLLVEATVNETCFGCHEEKRGPFLFEHAPVREDCMNCHLPHGSNHEMLLATARPFLCQQCHTSTGHMNDLLTRGMLGDGSAPDARLMGRSCQNCHAQIHGSNHPAGARFQR